MEFDDEHGRILAMKSLEGEVVPLKTPVTISADVEVHMCVYIGRRWRKGTEKEERG